MDDGKQVTTKPIRVVMDDPIRFYDGEGRRIIPAKEWEGLPLGIKGMIDVTVEEAKKFMRLENNLEDELIQELIDGAIDDISAELNRGWPTADDIPVSIKTAIKQTVLYRYENRGDDNIPDTALSIISRYKFIPGL